MAKIVKKKNSHIIPDDEKVRVTTMGSIIEVQSSTVRGKGGKIRKIDKDHYIDTDTGEVKEFKQHRRTSRKENYNSLYKTFRTAKEIINANFRGVEYTSWLTLTYTEKMTDIKQFDKDFEAFIKRIRRWYYNNKVKYFIALEFGANGGFHCHCLLYWEDKAPVFTDTDLHDLWNKGTLYEKPLKDKSAIRNIGAYLTSHLSDMPIEEYRAMYPSRKINNEDIKTIPTGDDIFSFKQFVKNARLALYPPNFRIFRHSKNMVKAHKAYETYGEIREDIKDLKFELTYTGTIDIHTDNDLIITQQYEYYEAPD